MKLKMPPPADHPKLFPMPAREHGADTPMFPRLHHPIWTEHKARLIERYLQFFVIVAKRGTYIDGFAGPQEPSQPGMWSANLVLDSFARSGKANKHWILRHYHFFDSNRAQVRRLKHLAEQHREAGFDGEINVYRGDFNVAFTRSLVNVKANEATFCLLDQRTFECQWRTVRKLATHKVGGAMKIELFYFFPIKWLRRALSGLKGERQKLKLWWGREDWKDVSQLQPDAILAKFVDRLRNELGYKTVTPLPIWERRGSPTIMYYMIHATDHPDAPKLMRRAYRMAVEPVEPPEQMEFEVQKLLGSTET